MKHEDRRTTDKRRRQVYITRRFGSRGEGMVVPPADVVILDDYEHHDAEPYDARQPHPWTRR